MSVRTFLLRRVALFGKSPPRRSRCHRRAVCGPRRASMQSRRSTAGTAARPSKAALRLRVGPDRRSTQATRSHRTTATQRTTNTQPLEHRVHQSGSTPYLSGDVRCVRSVLWMAKEISVGSQFPAPAATGRRGVEGSVWLMESLETGDFGIPRGTVGFTSIGQFAGVGRALDEPHYLMAYLPLHSVHFHSAALGFLSTRSVGRLSSGRSSRTDLHTANSCRPGGIGSQRVQEGHPPRSQRVIRPWPNPLAQRKLKAAGGTPQVR
jgi:hypothetical protein